jgi:16S rRNA processing protein RimM
MQLVVGRIGRPHGVRGEVTVQVRTDDPELRFAPGATLQTEPASAGPLVVEDLHAHSGRLLLTFVGVRDRTAAEALRGALLVVDVDPEDSPEDPEEFFDHQLVGLAAVTVDGTVVGEVQEVLHLPGQHVLAIRRAGGDEAGEVLVPFVAAMVPEVDLAGRRVVLNPPPGLLDLHEAP